MCLKKMDRFSFQLITFHFWVTDSRNTSSHLQSQYRKHTAEASVNIFVIYDITETGRQDSLLSLQCFFRRHSPKNKQTNKQATQNHNEQTLAQTDLPCAEKNSQTKAENKPQTKKKNQHLESEKVLSGFLR